MVAPGCSLPGWLNRARLPDLVSGRAAGRCTVLHRSGWTPCPAGPRRRKGRGVNAQTQRPVPWWGLTAAGLVLVAVGLEVVASAWANSPVPPWRHWPHWPGPAEHGSRGGLRLPSRPVPSTWVWPGAGSGRVPCWAPSPWWHSAPSQSVRDWAPNGQRGTDASRLQACPRSLPGRSGSNACSRFRPYRPIGERVVAV